MTTGSVLIILFGATGDLAHKKILPALYKLFANEHAHKRVPFVILGIAKEVRTREVLCEAIKEYVEDIREDTWQSFVEHIVYHKQDITDEPSYGGLKEKIETVERTYMLSGNRLFYCAIGEQLFVTVTRYLVQATILQSMKSQESQESGETSQKSIWHRIAYEKPFGHDLASAREINQEIQALIDVHQVFRVDHYIAKELINTILFLRFANRIFESLWNHQEVSHIEIRLHEKKDIEGRGKFYDHVGAVLDVAQNHLLQLLALVGMNRPEHFNANSIHDAKKEVLSHVSFVTGLLGQYEGYQQEAHVQPDSKTETFAALLFHVNTPRWDRVPFFVRTGKALAKKEVYIKLYLRPVNCDIVACDLIPQNMIEISIDPEIGIKMGVNVKRRSHEKSPVDVATSAHTPEVSSQDIVTPVTLDFCYSCTWPNYQDAYESIFQHIIRGDRTLFVRFDEIEEMWRIADTIKSAHLPLYTYRPGSEGPEEIQDFMKREGLI